MRKALLLAAVCTALALTLSAPAMAQNAPAPSSGGGTPLPASGECPTGTQAAPTATGEDTQCIPNAQLGDYLRAIGEGGATRTSTASPATTPTASPTASATASAAASASVSALPAAGGPAVSVLALGSLALLVGAGIMAFGLMNRG